ncbi:hypothetical protein K449DRAFT_465745 [Hypoxylon sp. EC38]|nr:hypothetical protein K449DRAFT_465745 [Hypoxylon sp. EC38]
MLVEGTQLYNDGDWTLMYIFLGLAPIIFVSIALYSTWDDTATKGKNDIEMVAGQTFRRPRRFPWKEAIITSEQSDSAAASPSYTGPPGRTGTRPPVPPPSLSKPSGSSKGQRTKDHERDRKTARVPAQPRLRDYEYGESEPSGGISKHSENFLDIPL